MNDEGLLRVAAAAPERCRLRHPLAPCTAYKVGGPADLFGEPETLEELAAILRAAHREGVPIFFLGGGTNTVIRDGGIRGAVIRLTGGFRRVVVEGERLRVGAAATMMRAAAAAEKAGLAGLEFGYDIPGTMGGALRMNAGCHGREVKDVLEEARGLTPDGEPRVIPADRIHFAYRTALYPEPIFLTEGIFALRAGDREAIAAERRRNHAYRFRTQPRGRSVGSVFKNPPGDYAGRLIEAAGMKGFRVGGAAVSEKHANFILNEGGGTAADIEAIIRAVRDAVAARFGVSLELEARIVGEPAVPEEAAR